MIKVLFVCMGNICRSPTAEGVFRLVVEEAGLADQVMIDSAGTHAYHIGEPPDTRAQTAAASRGIDLSGLRGRKVNARDIEKFDYVLAMDQDNYSHLSALSPGQLRSHIRLLMDYAPECRHDEVPDPYFGGSGGFEHVLDMITEASHGLLGEIRKTHQI